MGGLVLSQISVSFKAGQDHTLIFELLFAQAFPFLTWGDPDFSQKHGGE